MPAFVHRCLMNITRCYPLWSGPGTLLQMPPLTWIRFREQSLTVPLAGGGVRVVVFPNDFVGKKAYFFGDLDPKLTKLLRCLLEPGDTFVDIGANVGIVSFQCVSSLGSTGRVVAVEPQKPCVRALLDTIAFNGLSNVEVHQMALSDSPGIGCMEVEVPGNLGTAELRRIDRRETEFGFPRDEVQIQDAGEFFSNLSIRGEYVVKLDVEGHEAPITTAASRYFVAGQIPKALVFESWTTARNSRSNEQFQDIQKTLSRP